MGIAGAAAIAGNVPVGVATNLTLIDTVTQAFIAGQVGNLAPVQNVEVRAFAKEDVLAISGALSVSTGSFGINLAASLPVISIDSETSAFVDANGFVDALGNVLIKARDDTDTDTIGGNGSLSGAAGASVGATASVTIIDKETRAWIGQNATVHADGDTTPTIDVANGPVSFDFNPVSAVNLAANTINLATAGLTSGDEVIYKSLGGDEIDGLSDGDAYFVHVDPLNHAIVTLHESRSDALAGINPIDLKSGASGAAHRLYPVELGIHPTEAIHGLGVQAESTELTFTVAAAGKADFGFSLSITGSLGFLLLDSDAVAFIDTGATVTAEDVNVSATNDAWTFGAAVNIALTSGLGITGGVDLGLIRNDTTATIGGNVTAEEDVEVHALSRLQVDSFIGAVGVNNGGISLVASIGLYSIRANFAPIFGQDLLGFLNQGISGDTLQGQIDTMITSLTTTAGGGIANLLNNYAAGVGGGQQATASAIAAAAPSTPAQTAVGASLSTPGTTAHITGGTVIAGGDVEVSGEESIDVVIDSSFTFNFPLGDTIIEIANDRGILSTGGTAGAFIEGGAQVTADNVRLRGEVTNDQRIAGTTAVNVTNNSVKAIINGATVTSTAGDVELLAESNSQVVYMAILPALSLSTTLQTKSATNIIKSQVDAHISGGSVVTAQGDVRITAHERSKVFVVANATTIKKGGSFALAIAMVDNEVANTVKAYAEASTVTATTGVVEITAISFEDILAVSVGVAVETGGKFSGGGSYNTNNVHSSIEAYINGGTVIANGSVHLLATDMDGVDRTSIVAISGGASISGGSAALGVAIATNQFANVVSARIDTATVTSQTGEVRVEAKTNPHLTVLALGVGAADKFGAEGTITLNHVESTVEARITGAGIVTGATNVRVIATDGSLDRNRSPAAQRSRGRRRSGPRSRSTRSAAGTRRRASSAPGSTAAPSTPRAGRWRSAPTRPRRSSRWRSPVPGPRPSRSAARSRRTRSRTRSKPASRAAPTSRPRRRSLSLPRTIRRSSRWPAGPPDRVRRQSPRPWPSTTSAARSRRRPPARRSRRRPGTSRSSVSRRPRSTASRSAVASPAPPGSPGPWRSTR